MAQQTAVEWLEDNLIGNPHTENDFIHNRNVFQQAKAMEKEQINKACYDGYYKEDEKYTYEYYNETYE